jgi:hypothetical protein
MVTSVGVPLTEPAAARLRTGNGSSASPGMSILMIGIGLVLRLISSQGP